MMLVRSITVPAKTLYTSPVSQVFSVTLPRLSTVSIAFPDGCIGLVGVRIFDRGSMLVPFDGGWITGNAAEVDAQPLANLEGSPYQIRIDAYNQDTIYPHTVTVRMELG